ncbi:hypothetical protein AX16_007016 [Volvariella volvacea WC 439]|nr:hypothetical protein AX16_007016 [Volvariella volvacea WC 439]
MLQSFKNEYTPYLRITTTSIPVSGYNSDSSIENYLLDYEDGNKFEVQVPLVFRKPSVRGQRRQTWDAALLLKVYPPRDEPTPPTQPQECDYYCESVPISQSTEPESPPPSPIIRAVDPVMDVKGYTVDSEDELKSKSTGSEEHPLIQDSPRSDCSSLDEDEDAGQGLCVSHVYRQIFSSLLPQHTGQLKTQHQLTGWRKALAELTIYGKLKCASTPSEFETCQNRLKSEWQWSGGFLLVLTGIDVAILAIGSDAIYSVDENAKRAAATSVMASAFGLIYTGYFHVRYNWIDADLFAERAKDVHGSYALFALSARLPTLFMLISGACLSVFLFVVGYDARPEAALALCALAGLFLTTRFLMLAAFLVLKITSGIRVHAAVDSKSNEGRGRDEQLAG